MCPINPAPIKGPFLDDRADKLKTRKSEGAKQSKRDYSFVKAIPVLSFAGSLIDHSRVALNLMIKARLESCIVFIMKIRFH